MSRVLKIVLGVLLVLLVIQLVRFDRTNPPVTADIDTPPDVKAALHRACYDCHSNETTWPWYANWAPVSWLLHRDVVEGRRHLNFSEWDKVPPEKRARRMKGIAREVKSGDMPPWFYLPMHPAAKLSEADKTLIENWADGAAR